MIRDLIGQARRLSRALLLMCVLMIILVLVVCTVPMDILHLLLQDPAAAYDLPFNAGMVSHLGVLLWIVVGVFASRVGRANRGDHALGGLLCWAGCFSIVLGLDDLFLLHELAIPGVGIPEFAVLGVYGALLVALIWTHRRTILATDYLLLVLSSTAFCLSIVLDEGPDIGLPLLWRLGHTPLEDVFKLVGIVAWCAYFLQTGFHFATGAKTRSGAATA